MADQKISQLNDFASPLDTDIIPVADLTANQTKKTTFANLKTTFWTNPIIVGTLTAALLMGGIDVGSNMTYKSTSGNGTAAGIAHQFTGGNNGGTVILTMLNNGNVGIGTTAPVNKVEIQGNTTGVGGTGSVLKVVQNGAWSGNTPYALEVVGYSNLGGFRINGSVGVRGIYQTRFGTQLDFASNDGAITFTNTVNGTTERMRIDTNGNVGIGTMSPTAVLHLKAGTATASTAPLKFTSGVLLTSPEAGALEFVTDTLSFTITTGTARKTILFTDGSAASLTGLPAASVVAGTLGTGAYVMDTKLTVPQVINTNNAITASGNAATVPVTSKVNTVTNNSAATLTITLTTTAAVDRQVVIVCILDASAVAQTITWVNTENSGVTAPTTSNGSTTLPLTVFFMYNNATSLWRCVGFA